MSDRNTSELLTVDGLNLEFRSARGRIRALRDVSLTVAPGRVVGVVGESGCGKSTLVAAIMGLLADNARITSGRMMFRDHDLQARGAEKLRGAQMSMIFQDPMTALNPVVPIGRMMVDIQHRERVPRAEKRRRAASMLEKVGIADAGAQLDAYPHQFSGGMRQRICIAMALLVSPELLLADEPTTALDATLEVQIIRLLKALQADIGCAILFVTHHLGVVAELCDDVVVMYAGEVVEAGRVRDIFYNAQHPYTQALLACDPARIAGRAERLPTIPGSLPDLIEPPPGCIFKARCPSAFATCESVRPPRIAVSEHHHSVCHLNDSAICHDLASAR